VGVLSEALEWVERARGRLYDFHQMMGHADRQMQAASEQLEAAGHAAAASLICREVVGRNVLEGRWTFHVVDEFDDCSYQPVRSVERSVRQDLVDGRRHVYEYALKGRERGHRS
jgi:hypothetical protein